jgi:hypothetical protein
VRRRRILLPVPFALAEPIAHLLERLPHAPLTVAQAMSTKLQPRIRRASATGRRSASAAVDDSARTFYVQPEAIQSRHSCNRILGTFRAAAPAASLN